MYFYSCPRGLIRMNMYFWGISFYDFDEAYLLLVLFYPLITSRNASVEVRNISLGLAVCTIGRNFRA